MSSNPDTATALLLAVCIGVSVTLAANSPTWGITSVLFLIYVSSLARGLLYVHHGIAHVREEERRQGRERADG